MSLAATYIEEIDCSGRVWRKDSSLDSVVERLVGDLDIHSFSGSEVSQSSSLIIVAARGGI